MASRFPIRPGRENDLGAFAVTSSLLRHEAPDGPPPLAGGRGRPPRAPAIPARSEVQAFIARIYAQRFGARVQQFTPCLVSLRDPLSGELVAAAGYRFADTG
ncbi:MAG: thermostable hemolysin, partial [Hydrogenophaga sp.]|nr:thermostable hemolysin [Hydrogenophaga sp.]